MSQLALVPHRDSLWRAHGLTLAFITAAALILSAVLWLHPSAGYANADSIIAGADLRADLIALLWIALAVVASVSSLVVGVGGRFTRRATALVPAGLVTGALVVVAIAPLLDRYF